MHESGDDQTALEMSDEEYGPFGPGQLIYGDDGEPIVDFEGDPIRDQRTLLSMIEAHLAIENLRALHRGHFANLDGSARLKARREKVLELKTQGCPEFKSAQNSTSRQV